MAQRIGVSATSPQSQPVTNAVAAETLARANAAAHRAEAAALSAEASASSAGRSGTYAQEQAEAAAEAAAGVFSESTELGRSILAAQTREQVLELLGLTPPEQEAPPSD